MLGEPKAAQTQERNHIIDDVRNIVCGNKSGVN